MQSILTQLDKVLEDGILLSKNLKIREDKIIAQEALLLGSLNHLEAKNKEFAIRESAVVGVENAQKLMSDAQKLMKTAQEEAERITIKSREYNDYVIIENQKLDSQRQMIQRESNSLQEARKHVESEVCKRVNEFVKKLKSTDNATA